MEARHHTGMANRRRRPRVLHDVNRIPHLSTAEKASLKAVTDKYAFRANEYYLNLIDWNDPDDPIRRLVIPHVNELRTWGAPDSEYQ